MTEEPELYHTNHKTVKNTVTISDSRARLLMKCVDVIGGYANFSQGQDGYVALIELKRFIDEIAGTVAPYGYCPHCLKPGVSRERRPDGNDTCQSGHVYPSRCAR